MSDPSPEGPGLAKGPGRFALVRAVFYEELAARLTEGAMRALEESGVEAEQVDLYDVPGAFELPLAAKACAESGRYAGVVCLGVVIRGETDHYEYVCSETVRGCGEVALATGVPVAFGVLTCETLAQARDRSGAGPKNKGREAARAAVETASLLLALRAEGGA